MKMTRLVFSLLVTAIASGSQAEVQVGARSNQVSARLNKSIYLMGEPMEVTAVIRPQLSDLHDSTVHLGWTVVCQYEDEEPEFRLAEWRVINPKLPILSNQFALTIIDNRPTPLTADGEFIVSDWFMAGFRDPEKTWPVVFDKPGRYRFRAVYWVRYYTGEDRAYDKEGTKFHSDPVTVQVINPQGQDKEFWDVVTAHPEAFPYVTRAINVAYDNESHEILSELWDQAFKRFPGSTYAYSIQRFLEERYPSRLDYIIAD